MIEFFMAMIPPTATAQMHKIGVKNGKAFVYDPPRVVQMKAKLRAHLSEFKPEKPLEGPLKLTTQWIWPHEDPEYTDAFRWKPTEPDLDNMMKAWLDALEYVGFYHNDAQICSVISEKFYGSTPGIYVKFELLT